ncbi:MAG: hypothetical protein GY702_17100 [Desulfobulbaceae bacterium]|nr:hypothetical protein [Desulfobulbaceae bacterium]
MKNAIFFKVFLTSVIFTVFVGYSVTLAANKVVVIPFVSENVTTPTTGYVSIPPSALLPKDDSVSYSTNGAYMGTGAASKAVFYAPVLLPHNATITSATLVANDNSGGEFGGYVEAALVRLGNNSVTVISTMSTGGPGEDTEGDVQLSETVNYNVDNSTHSYGISVGLHNGAGGAWSVLYYRFLIEYEK